MIVILAGTLSKADPLDSLIDMLPENKKTLAHTAIKLIPDNQKRGLQDYLAITGVVADREENLGFSNYNQSYLDKNQCFQRLAAEFYASIRADDLNYAAGKKIGKGYFASPSLDSQLEDVGLKPGWLWNKALAFSGGDKRLAMQLIGTCGHDDKMQLKKDMNLNTQDAEKIRNDFSDEKIRANLTSWWKSLPEEERKRVGTEYLESVYQISKERNDILKGVICPDPSSIMYYPKALGDQFDIPTDLKNKIVKIQAPIAGAGALPAKAYHVIGQAFAACHLKSRNIPDIVSKKIVLGAVNAYRSARVCEKLRYQSNKKFYLNSVDENLNNLKKIRANSELCFTFEKRAGVTYPYYRMSAGDDKALCEITQILGTEIVLDPDVTDAILKKKIVRLQAENDIARLFMSSPEYKTANKCTGPQLSNAVSDYLKEHGTDGVSPCPDSMSKERCLEARKVMDTYSIDFEWSEAQHLAGLKFAQENCSDTTYDPEVAACKKIREDYRKKSNQGTSDPRAGVR